MLSTDTITISIAGVAVSILMPVILRIVDYLIHRFRRWQQKRNVRDIVQRGIEGMLDDRPRVAMSTDPGTVGEERPTDLNSVRFTYFQQMMFELGVVMEYYSSDLSYTGKRDILGIRKLENVLNAWTMKRNGAAPTKDVYEDFIIKRIKDHKWIIPIRSS